MALTSTRYTAVFGPYIAGESWDKAFKVGCNVGEPHGTVSQLIARDDEKPERCVLSAGRGIYRMEEKL
jgi:hypothetical protein